MSMEKGQTKTACVQTFISCFLSFAFSSLSLSCIGLAAHFCHRSLSFPFKLLYSNCFVHVRWHKQTNTHTDTQTFLYCKISAWMLFFNPFGTIKIRRTSSRKKEANEQANKQIYKQTGERNVYRNPGSTLCAACTYTFFPSTFKRKIISPCNDSILIWLRTKHASKKNRRRRRREKSQPQWNTVWIGVRTLTLSFSLSPIHSSPPFSKNGRFSISYIFNVNGYDGCVCVRKRGTHLQTTTHLLKWTRSNQLVPLEYMYNMCGKRDTLLLLPLPCIRFDVRSNSFKFDNDIKFNYPVDTMHDMNKKGQSSCHISCDSSHWMTDSFTQEE